MRTLTLDNGHTASFYLSAHEITAGRYTEFQHYQMQDAGIGSDEEAVDRHFASLAARLAAAQADSKQLVYAADELALLHYNFQFMRGRDQPGQLAFAVLVGAVDGIPTTDLSEEGLKALISRLSSYGLTQGQIEDARAEFLKKKLRN
ncbi:hypothetical protein [Hymenobacter baengnokdamensis]|uniref:hypothetical protein n=1 Tax=Hymenobacter baengnokdamensis TaxID=2615203 RepID=UPI001245ECF4|nr:hypothetical protein [Hymenobacter baengnokdamensis]